MKSDEELSAVEIARRMERGLRRAFARPPPRWRSRRMRR